MMIWMRAKLPFLILVVTSIASAHANDVSVPGERVAFLAATHALVYKLASLATGLFICFLGYRLFIKGVWGSAGDLQAKFEKSGLVLKSAAPGTFFVVLGSFVIITTILMGLGYGFDINAPPNDDGSSSGRFFNPADFNPAP